MKNLDTLNDVSFNYKKEDFGDDFFWGVSSSPIQREEKQNKLEEEILILAENSIEKNAIASDNLISYYENYKEEIRLIKELGIPNFRLSIVWSLIIPNGIGSVNQEGINFYNKILDDCKENNIEPFVILHQCDLPLELEKKGGWTNRSILEWFEEYTTVCATAFLGKIKYWIVLNEPTIFVGAGYFLGLHTPAKKGLNNFLPAMHHAILCQSIGFKTIKQIDPSAQVGTSFSCTHITPKTYSEKNIKAAERIDTLLNKSFIEPSLGLGYPKTILPFLKHIEKYILQGDDELIKVDFDFINLQNHTREIVEHHSYTPYVNAKIIPSNKRNVTNTLLNWEIHPKSIYTMILKFSDYKGVKKIILTENGSTFFDDIKLDIINDEKRIFFIQNYLKQILYYKEKSDKIVGFFICSLTDNFKLTEGLKQRLGLIYVDDKTKKNVVKKSGKWYKDFLISKKQ